ncbi:Chitin bind 4 domain containing protein [Asbolus verrucosus]|uniref:Chitin bind 4 domain containing protein n=1 Tax=Asbolus verrucosus TaxID=1661398 RepID=A0A482VTT7_ASBVE|nr:Chitin bind 4 domain containing protein [Asbolus verrucosus]
MVLVQAQDHQSGHATSFITYSQGGEHSGSGGSLGDYSHLGGHILQVAPVVHAAPALLKTVQVADHHDEHHYAPPKYEFKYGVEDHHTGDIKSHQESRDGDVVKGEYSLHEPDGTILRVQYTADKHSGFNAVVHRQGHANHPQHYSAPSHHY